MDSTGLTGFVPFSASRDGRAERAYGRFIRQGIYQAEYFTVGNIIIVYKEERWEFQALYRLHRLEHGNHRIDELLD